MMREEEECVDEEREEGCVYGTAYDGVKLRTIFRQPRLFLQGFLDGQEFGALLLLLLLLLLSLLFCMGS
jgi:hypothetical protein